MSDDNFDCTTESQYGVFRAWLSPDDVAKNFPYFRYSSDMVGEIDTDQLVNRGFRCKITSKITRRPRMNVPAFLGRTYIRFIRNKTIITITIPGYYTTLRSIFENFASKIKTAMHHETSMIHRNDLLIQEKIVTVPTPLSEESVKSWILANGLPSGVRYDGGVRSKITSDLLADLSAIHGVSVAEKLKKIIQKEKDEVLETAEQVLDRLGIQAIMEAHLARLRREIRPRRKTNIPTEIEIQQFMEIKKPKPRRRSSKACGQDILRMLGKMEVH